MILEKIILCSLLTVLASAGTPFVTGQGSAGTITWTASFSSWWLYEEFTFSGINTGSLGNFEIFTVRSSANDDTSLSPLYIGKSTISAVAEPFTIAQENMDVYISCTYNLTAAYDSTTEFEAYYTFLSDANGRESFTGTATVTVPVPENVPSGPVQASFTGNFSGDQYIDWYYTIKAPYSWYSLHLDLLVESFYQVELIEVISDQSYTLDWLPGVNKVVVSSDQGLIIDTDFVIKITSTYSVLCEQYKIFGALYLNGAYQYTWSEGVLPYSEKGIDDSVDLEEDASLSSVITLDASFESLKSIYTRVATDTTELASIFNLTLTEISVAKSSVSSGAAGKLTVASLFTIFLGIFFL